MEDAIRSLQHEFDRAEMHADTVRNVQRNSATYKGEHVELAVRVSHVWVRRGARWQLAGIQFSPMGGP